MITAVVHAEFGNVHRFPNCLAVIEGDSLRILDSDQEHFKDRARFASGSWSWYEHVTTQDKEK